MKVNKLILHLDFFIVHMNDSLSTNKSLILLGRSLMNTTRAKIDVHKGILNFESRYCHLHYLVNMKHVEDPNSIFMVDVISPLIGDFVENHFKKDKFEQVFFNGSTDNEATTKCDEKIREANLQNLLCNKIRIS